MGSKSQKDDRSDDDPESAIAAQAPRLRNNANSAGELRQLQHQRPQTPPPQFVYSSCWQTAATTPMTSRPHFRHEISPNSIRRVRSRSLGSAVDAARMQQQTMQLDEYPVHFDDWRDYVLPSKAPPHNNVPQKLPAHKQLKSSFVPSPTLQVEEEKPLLLEESASLDDDNDDDTLENDRKEEMVEKTSSTKRLPSSADPGNPVWLCVMYGLINATIVLPVLMSFASIIYRDQAFAPAMPTLTKLTLVSGMVHQVCFSTFSSLPFSIGQVQDAGLIFLSSMATTIVDYCRSHGHDLETVLATATIGIPISTALLGVGLIFLGRWRLAQYVQLLPTCVVGGYLAYIGWFCGLAGVGLMAGGASEITMGLVAEKWYLVLPGVVGGCLLYVSVRTCRHMAVLPCGIMILLALFYIIVYIRGVSIQDVTDQGWIRQTDDDASLSWVHTWDLMKFDKVAWGVMPSLILTEISMIFVVALSSSLDVAAIEIELQRPLDYNHELQTVGVSNLVSGLTGGYTGSYIFSQSIFSLRAGIRSRLAGYTLAAAQLVVFLAPIPILSFVPSFFFGALLSLICVDLVYEWLWQVRDKVTAVEYVICLSTFGLIQIAGVEYGILLGVALYLALRKTGFDVGNKSDASEQREDADGTDSLVTIRKEEPDSRDYHPGNYGTLDVQYHAANSAESESNI
eukprot:scaffold2418_cov175-Amphora_coffeaeformis.AAC.2